MLTDFYLANNPQLKNITTNTKNKFTENEPYVLRMSGNTKDEPIVIFHDHFIRVLRMVLSDSTGLTISQMSDSEKVVYYAYIEYLNNKWNGLDNDTINPKLLYVLIKLDYSIFQAILNNKQAFKNQEYLNTAFNQPHSWK